MINLSEIAPSLVKAIIKAQVSDIEGLFSKGEVIQGRVIKELGKDGALVRLRGMELIAATKKPLVSGQPILVKVEGLKPNFIVSLLPNETPIQEKTAALLRLYLPQKAPVDLLLKDLAAFLPSLPKSVLRKTGVEEVLRALFEKVPKSTTSEKGGNEKNVFRLLGFFHESEMADGKPEQNLKRSLLLLRQNLENLQGGELAKHRKPLSKIIQTIQNIELRQLVSSDDAQPQKSWEFPFFNGREFSSAQVIIKKDSEKSGQKGSRKPSQFSLMVEMSALGPVRADIRLEGKLVVGDIYAENRESMEKLREEISSVIGILEKAGFVPNLSVHTAKKEFLTEKPLSETFFSSKGLLSLKA